jgi:hypothetical protein
MGIGSLRNSTDAFALEFFSGNIRLRQQNRLNMSDPAGNGVYASFNHGYAMTNVAASHRIATNWEGVLQLQNLTNRYTNDKDAAYATVGRQANAGVRIQLR